MSELTLVAERPFGDEAEESQVRRRRRLGGRRTLPGQHTTSRGANMTNEKTHRSGTNTPPKQRFAWDDVGNSQGEPHTNGEGQKPPQMTLNDSSAS